MTKPLTLGAMLLTTWVAVGSSVAAEPRPVAHWAFDAVENGHVRDHASGKSDAIGGEYLLVPGVRGKALLLDGYSTRLVRDAKDAPAAKGPLTVEAWVALGAYPWNWAPIACRERTETDEATRENRWWPATLVEGGKHRGWYFGIGPRGELGLMFAVDGRWKQCVSAELAIPLRKWTHVAAVFDAEHQATLYIDGAKAAEFDAEGPIEPAADEPLRIGFNREPRKASHPVRPFATLASYFGLDGLLDDVKVYDVALTAEQVERRARAVRPGQPALARRVLPSGPDGPAKFGAYYERLKYHPGWDRLWRVSPDPDVVVRFDDSPVRVVFWRGMRYSPAWVMENGLWMADQSIEAFNDIDGCIEHMLDPWCRFSRVRIIESNAARAVVHWRYCPIAADGAHSRTDPITGRSDWVDEYYTFYPDGMGVRGIIYHTDGGRLGPQEFICICHPGQRPEDVVELEAMTVANLQGKVVTYSWEHGSPKFLVSRDGTEFVDFGDDPAQRPVIAMVNTKSKYRPFEIFGRRSLLTIFGHELREDASHFPWWNHWPVALIPSDGRYAQAPDRPSHFSLAWGRPPANPGKDGKHHWYAWLYGATDRPAAELIPLGRSWNDPPLMSVEGDAFVAQGYEPLDRTYRIARKRKGDQVKIELAATEKSPAIRPAVLIRGWGDRGVRASIDGRPAREGKDYRAGTIRRLSDNDLVVWFNIESTSAVEFTLTGE